MTAEARSGELKTVSSTILKNCKRESGDWVRSEKGDLETVYYRLGELFSKKIKSGVSELKNDPQDFQARFDRSEKFEKHIIDLSAKEGIVGSGAIQYFGAINSWATAAGITIKEALMLQDDNLTGCQTAMVRLSPDRVIMTHTEEADGITQEMTVAPVIQLNIEGSESLSVVYDKLLPGSATFGAGDGFAVACDYLRTKDVKEGKGIVNALSWMIWNLGDDATPKNVKELVEGLGPYVDAYAINVVRRASDQSVEAFRVTVAGGQYALEMLGDNPGDNFVQVNLIDPKMGDGGPGIHAVTKADLDAEDDTLGYWEGFLGRIARMKGLIRYFTRPKYLEAIGKMSDHDLSEKLIELMGAGAKVPGDWGLANSFSGIAGCVSVSAKNESAVLNLGPVVRGFENERKVFDFEPRVGP